MGALLRYDNGPTLVVTCDRCAEQIMAFGLPETVRSDLESRLIAEGWTFGGDVAWLCTKCGGGRPERVCVDRFAAVSVLKMPE